MYQIVLSLQGRRVIWQRNGDDHFTNEKWKDKLGKGVAHLCVIWSRFAYLFLTEQDIEVYTRYNFEWKLNIFSCNYLF